MSTLASYKSDDISKELATWNLSIKKRWGQNFLVDKNICNRIAHNILTIAGYPKVDPARVWEIGPGFAGLTESILDLAPHVILTLFEIDYGIIKRLHVKLEEQGLQKQVTIVGGDAGHSLIEHSKRIRLDTIPQVICGNLPYSSGVRLLIAASRIASKIALSNQQTQSKTLTYIPMCTMLQKEAAERLCATHGNKEYGISTVLLQVMYHINLMFSVSPTAFTPPPHVESVMCSLIPRTDVPLYSLDHLDMLTRIVQASFAHRRKTLKNTLGNFLASNNIENYDEICSSVNIDLSMRAENITPDQYMALSLKIRQ